MIDASIALGGGMSLAAYHGGVLEQCLGAGVRFHAFAGASAGAVTCAILAGAPEGEGIPRLEKFWGFNRTRSLRISSASGWMSVLARRVFGETGQFHLRPPIENLARFKSIYDLEPMKAQLTRLVDFGRLNRGPRVCVVATDLRTGDPVVFDTAKGTRITIDHLLASCGFLPEFAPVDIDGRSLGDGGLSWNVPFDALLDEAAETGRVLFLADLFARDGPSPNSLAMAAERKNDLMFGNQTHLRLQAALRDPRLAALSVYLLSYRGEAPEAGAEKPYDYSPDAIAQRWQAGLADMKAALAKHAMSKGGGLHIIRRAAPHA
jgi:NTE family protein